MKRFHLKLVAGKVPSNAKKFDTFSEFEVYLKSRNKVTKAKATALVVKKLSHPPGRSSSANGYANVTDFGDRYFAQFEFHQFLIDGYAEIASLEWSTSNSIVMSGLGSPNFYSIQPGLDSFFYTHENGSRTNNYLTAYGEYEEFYSIGGGTFLLKFKYEINAGWDTSSGISANATIYPKY